ncbi:MAG: hypothetical protein K1X28_09960 [Parachlamydiales bacterium]|nr:hypothetical protein [Parachlamydiales bacterium]
MNRYLLILLSLAAAACFGVETKQNNTIRGVVLCKNENDLALPLDEEKKGIILVGVDLPGAPFKLEAILENEYFGKEISPQILSGIKEKILLHYKMHHRPVVSVEIPEQEVENGIVQMVVVEASLGEILFQGNCHFRDGQLRRYIKLCPGDQIDTNRLLSDLAFMNRNPFRITNATFAPGKEQNTTDILLLTRDRLTWRFYTGGDNTGNDFTGQARWFAGVNWGNVFGWDHVLSYQFTTSSDYGQFQAHTFNYSIPLPIHHTLTLFGGFSFVHPDLSSLNSEVMPPTGHLKNDGFTGQASLRYHLPWGKNWIAQLTEMIFGWDYKYMNNNLEYISENSVPIVYKSVNLFQLVVGTDLAYQDEKHKISCLINVYGSPGELFGRGNNNDFNNLRNKAINQYIYARLMASDEVQFGRGFSFNPVLRFQGASGALLPSEQMPIGGYDTVRGYDERIFNADNAFISNVEMRWSGSHCLWRQSSLRGRFTALIFFDYGRGWNYPSLSNDKKDEYLMGIGPGIRYELGSYLNFRADYGIKLHKDSIVGTSFGKFHLGLIASY